MSEPVRVLFVNSEMEHFMPSSVIATVGRYLPQGIQESGAEIRSFVPRYGTINERRYQLHEVIRLSGMNIIINDIDRPLVIKVSSISAARMQVYFIDNEDYFHRKYVYTDDSGKYFTDNDERAVFFARGVLETVKKLRWKPDIIHCQGWISHFLPLYLRKVYSDDPIFTDSKVVLSLYNESLDMEFNEETRSKVIVPGIRNRDFEVFDPVNGINLAKLALQYSNGVIIGSKDLPAELEEAIKSSHLKVLPYREIDHPENSYIQDYKNFYDQILGNNDKKV
ncbi:MAG: glycogen/starch synthase [Bacteroidales bacterium]|jgi:starch synthase|nr:glycogen/starch synthase [Bacteroidales bacterium]